MSKPSTDAISPRGEIIRKLQADNQRIREAGAYFRSAALSGENVDPGHCSACDMHHAALAPPTGRDDKPVGPHPDGGFYVQPGDKGDKPTMTITADGTGRILYRVEKKP